jgi:Rrf2 family protein
VAAADFFLTLAGCNKVLMKITNEKRYALRAVFELAKRDGSGPVKSADIARAQGIPARFLEVILCKLTRIGLVKSKRGYQGGFVLGRSAREITVGSVFEPLESAVCPEGTMHCAAGQGCPFSGTCVFLPLWNRVQRSIHEVYRNTTIQDLLNGEGVLPPALLGEKPGEVPRQESKADHRELLPCL